MTRYASVLGLAFGDCGKGLFVDALTRRWQAHTVVRFNGGAQAGHNVATPADASGPARHHTFSQFGAGTFVPGVRTLLVDPMIVHPTALLVEAEALDRVGVRDALSRIGIDARCRITTPFHQAAGRLRELLRGSEAHGTCGVGVGETVRHALEYPGQEIRYSDLAASSAAAVRTLIERLQTIRTTLLSEFAPHCEGAGGETQSADFQTLRDETLAERWLTTARAIARHSCPLEDDAIASELRRPGCVLFEGAQGALLDEWRGFHPHTTWSTINTSAVESVTARFALNAEIEHYGVIRSYLTRHGIGPFPTHDETLDHFLPEPHNSSEGWQGSFRRGHPDAILLQYALETVGKLSGLLLSHLDIFKRGVALKWCPLYHHLNSNVDRLSVCPTPNLHHQTSLTHLLQSVRPEYDANEIRSAPEMIARISNLTTVPLKFASHGPTRSDVIALDI